MLGQSLSSMSHYSPGVAVEDVNLILQKTPLDVWQFLRNKRIFLTGGTGFVGCWMLEALLWANEQLQLQLQVHVLTRDPPAFRLKAAHLADHECVRLVAGNVVDLNAINDSFDIVIHAATDVINPESDPVRAFDAIVAGTRETLALADRAGAKIYLLTSSGAVYGNQPPSITHVDETYLGAPSTSQVNTAYGQAKRVAEWMSQCSTAFDVKIARCFALVGPYLPLDAQFAVGNFIRDGLAGNDIHVSGDGTALRSYLYAADMIVWLLTVMVKGEARCIYNVGSTHSLSIKELADQVSELVYKKNRVKVAQVSQSSSAASRYVPSVVKIKAELGVDEYTDLTTALEKMLRWELRRRCANENKSQE